MEAHVILLLFHSRLSYLVPSYHRIQQPHETVTTHQLTYGNFPPPSLYNGIVYSSACNFGNQNEFIVSITPKLTQKTPAQLPPNPGDA